MGFLAKLQKVLNDTPKLTENGAVGYATTGKALLDLNFAVSSLRNATDEQVVNEFTKAYFENKLLAVKWLFFAADVREGMGERRLMRVCLRFLAKVDEALTLELLPLIPYYTRWDNVLALFGTQLQGAALEFIAEQLADDRQKMAEGKPISLCAKWLPSINASSATAREQAKVIAAHLGWSAKEYRQLLAKLRAYLQVVEVKMSAKAWADIDYSSVPSKANLLYGAAFFRNDEMRRTQFLQRVEKGEEKINAGVLYPHDIVAKYMARNEDFWAYGAVRDRDEALEAMWKALPDYVKGEGNTLCVADGSGSMTIQLGDTHTSALDVANALAIYFAERCTGEFHDKYITFSRKPQLVDMSNCSSLHEKIALALAHNEVDSTDIEAVFMLILGTAVKHGMAQGDMPRNVMILSDMEFNVATYGTSLDTALFEELGRRFEQYGYKLPRLVFWNINSRTRAIPLKQNDMSVALVSGFSPTVTSMVLSNKLDPFECLLEKLNDARYNAVENAFNSIK